MNPDREHTASHCFSTRQLFLVVGALCLIAAAVGYYVKATASQRRATEIKILIHSTNAPAADSMLLTLRDAGWVVDRISPLGDDWIEAYWYPYAMRMIDSAS